MSSYIICHTLYLIIIKHKGHVLVPLTCVVIHQALCSPMIRPLTWLALAKVLPNLNTLAPVPRKLLQVSPEIVSY